MWPRLPAARAPKRRPWWYRCARAPAPGDAPTPGCWKTIRSKTWPCCGMDGPAAPALKVGPSEQVREGRGIRLHGLSGRRHPGGFLPSPTRGLVSSITTMALPSPTSQQLSERAIRSVRSGPQQVFQLDQPRPTPAAACRFVRYPQWRGVWRHQHGAGQGNAGVSTQPASGITYAIPSRYVADVPARHP